jgi:hypothetical protein
MDINELTLEEKQQASEMLKEFIDNIIFSDSTKKLEINIERGTFNFYNRDILMYRNYNNTLTLTVKINGGARDTYNLD